MPGYKLGFLTQEPRLDENLTVFENIVQSVTDKLKMSDMHERVCVSSSPPLPHS